MKYISQKVEHLLCEMRKYSKLSTGEVKGANKLSTGQIDEPVNKIKHWKSEKN